MSDSSARWGSGSPSRRSSSLERPQFEKRASMRSGRTRSSYRAASPTFSRRASFGQRSYAFRPPPARRESFRLANVRRWDGTRRITTEWDSLRRDPELWLPDGDCLIHLYGRGHSRRGPSLRLPFSLIKSAKCGPLLDHYSVQTLPESPYSTTSGNSSDSGYFDGHSTSGKCELYVPAPPQCSREEAFRYHITTRNFFAWMMGKPIVGTHLGGSMVDLLDRLNLFRGSNADNVGAVLTYLDEQAYSSFRECPDLALASLYFAEHFQLKDRYIDAFVHSVGLNDRLDSSCEFQSISRMTKALIMRAKLEMDIRVEHCYQQLDNFLDYELSGTFLGLGKGARAHLDRFRSFLQSYYVAKFGYWPPLELNSLADRRGTYRLMYEDFRDLYEYLVDGDSTTSMEGNLRPVTGGLCVLQNLAAFDERHRHVPLPHPLPLLPQGMETASPKRSLRTVRLGRSISKAAKADKRSYTLAALSAATNVSSMAVMESPFVRAYMRFEKEYTLKGGEKVSPSDARKVRWILVVCVLQTLISVTCVPAEVRHTDNVTYLLCCQLAGTPPWENGAKGLASRTTSVRNSVVDSSMAVASASAGKWEIKPDTDFAFKTTLSKNVTVRSPQPRRLSHQEIVVLGYGNGLIDASVQDSSGASTPPQAEHNTRWSGNSSAFTSSTVSLPDKDSPPELAQDNGLERGSGSFSSSEELPVVDRTQFGARLHPFSTYENKASDREQRVKLVRQSSGNRWVNIAQMGHEIEEEEIGP